MSSLLSINKELWPGIADYLQAEDVFRLFQCGNRLLTARLGYNLRIKQKLNNFDLLPLSIFELPGIESINISVVSGSILRMCRIAKYDALVRIGSNSLKHLKLSFCQSSRIVSDSGPPLSTRFPSLHTLELTHAICPLSESILYDLPPNLETFVFSLSNYFRSSTFSHSLQFLSKLPRTLTKISMTMHMGQDADENPIQFPPNLRSLSLNRINAGFHLLDQLPEGMEYVDIHYATFVKKTGFSLSLLPQSLQSISVRTSGRTTLNVIRDAPFPPNLKFWNVPGTLEWKVTEFPPSLTKMPNESARNVASFEEIAYLPNLCNLSLLHRLEGQSQENTLSKFEPNSSHTSASTRVSPLPSTLQGLSIRYSVRDQVSPLPKGLKALSINSPTDGTPSFSFGPLLPLPSSLTSLIFYSVQINSVDTLFELKRLANLKILSIGCFVPEAFKLPDAEQFIYSCDWIPLSTTNLTIEADPEHDMTFDPVWLYNVGKRLIKLVHLSFSCNWKKGEGIGSALEALPQNLKDLSLTNFYSGVEPGDFAKLPKRLKSLLIVTTTLRAPPQGLLTNDFFKNLPEGLDSLYVSSHSLNLTPDCIDLLPRRISSLTMHVMPESKAFAEKTNAYLNRLDLPSPSSLLYDIR